MQERKTERLTHFLLHSHLTAASRTRTPANPTFHGSFRDLEVSRKITVARVAVKRMFDVIGALLLLVFILPACFIVAVAATVDGGPPFFGQQRIGRHGREFRCLKFRTMCVDADRVLLELLELDPATRQEWSATFKLKSDPRVSRIGRFLRSTSLDELPQLWNVLVRDMSLVGPRPVVKAELEDVYARYDGVQDYLAVRPGITGLWQVSGRCGISYESRVALDKTYVREFSLLGDAKILWRTAGTVLRRDGAC